MMSKVPESVTVRVTLTTSYTITRDDAKVNYDLDTSDPTWVNRVVAIDRDNYETNVTGIEDVLSIVGDDDDDGDLDVSFELDTVGYTTL
jgi:hypothetical protein